MCSCWFCFILEHHSACLLCSADLSWSLWYWTCLYAVVNLELLWPKRATPPCLDRLIFSGCTFWSVRSWILLGSWQKESQIQVLYFASGVSRLPKSASTRFHPSMSRWGYLTPRLNVSSISIEQPNIWGDWELGMLWKQNRVILLSINLPWYLLQGVLYYFQYTAEEEAAMWIDKAIAIESSFFSLLVSLRTLYVSVATYEWQVIDV